MTFESRDLIEKTHPRPTCIANANGVKYPVIGAGKLTLSSSLSLPSTLLVPALSNKLLSVGQATEEMNCCALIYPKYLFQDILTKEIIGRGTKREWLYYMDEFSVGWQTMLVNMMRKNEKFGCGINIWDTHHSPT